MKPQRRDFLKSGSISLVSIALLSRAGNAPAQAKGAPHVDEKDATAMALGYRQDATKVDKAKYANYKPDQHCANCVQFKGKPGDAWAACGIFPGKEVSGKGWCSAWQKKA